ncbi:MAG: NAD(P)H-hydrate dehydratase [Ignavibacteria bacterium]|nr:NAD(P)H-hydrate dehydratase [Ignavibacteria bacterium]
MKPAFNFGEIREAEKNIIEKEGIPSLILMENAGKNAFDVIVSLFPDISERGIFILCGKGNNAGDGYVIARNFLLNSIPVEVFNLALQSELKGDAIINFNILHSLNSKLCSMHNINENNFELIYNAAKNHKGKLIIIDALLGSGIKGSASGIFKKVIEQINKLRTKKKNLEVVSVDIPSGIGENSGTGAVINADHTITMGAVKTNLLYGRGKECTGNLYVVHIGIPAGNLIKNNYCNKYIIEESDVKLIFPVRKKTSYKYSNGKTLIIGGSKGLSGALILSSLAALKSGCGAVLSAFPKSISAHFSRKLSEVIKTELNETADGSINADSYKMLIKQIEKADAVLVGPGISLNNETANFIFELVTNINKPLVIDADALTSLADNLDILLNRTGESDIILTPHLGEFSKISGKSIPEISADMFNISKQFAAKYKVNLIVKSETSFSCTQEGEILINNTGNELLGNAGSGDVLSGITVSMLAQTKSIRSAMILGNYIHGRIAEHYYEKYGNKQSASVQDLIKFIPAVISEILN